MYSGDSVGTVINGSGCGLCGSGDNSDCGHLGGEWVRSGYGQCGACSFNCVKVPLIGKQCTKGTYAKCKKTKYSAAPGVCCFGNKPAGYPKQTCDPRYTLHSDACYGAVAGYCQQGNNIFSDAKCVEWGSVDANRHAALGMKQKYCEGKFGSDASCRAWAQSSEAQGQIDSIVVPFCQSNPNDPLCSCVNSEMTCPQKFDTNCIRNAGYKSFNDMNIPCPDVMNCNQYINLSPGAKAIASNFQQNCSTTTNIGTGDAVASVSSEKTNTNVSAKTNAGTAGNWGILLFILLVIVVLVIGAAFFLFDDDDESLANIFKFD